ncbi:MAG: ATP-binding protein [Desulfitobacteriaceae bacterium]
MFKKHIAFKLMAGFVLIVLVSMLAIGIFFIQMFRQYTFESRQNTLLTRAHSIAEIMSENSQGNGFMKGYGGFVRFLDTMSEAKVWITDNKGNPALLSGMGMGMSMSMGIEQGHSYNSEPLPNEAEKVIQEVLSGKESVSENFSSVYNEATLTVGVPILNSDKQVLGAVLLHAPVTGITDTLNRAISILAVSLLAALFPAIGLGIFYSMLFTRPLKAMNHSALEMTRGNYSARTGIKRLDELGQLGQSLDLLASKLGYTIDQLFQEKGKISDIISSISEGIVAFDLSLKPLNMNLALSEILNKTLPYTDEALEKDLETLGVNPDLKKIMENKQTSQVLKDWLGKKLMFTLSPIVDKQGEVTGSVALVQDISESERLEQFRKDFVANVSHEFRTPLTVIKGSLEAIVDGTVNQPEDVQRYHERMLSETRSLERLVGDLLKLSRLQAGQITLHKEMVHIPSLLADAVKSLQTLADKKGIQINYLQVLNIPPILGDYDRLRQLFVIFLDNAVKYSQENTVVTVELKVNEKVEITISDQGYGISEAELPYIWDRFYKADKSRRSNGTGLGLPIAKHLVELHDGQVALQSVLGKGTSVKVSLPSL